ncbi:MAG: DUF4013 domain-containing protein [Chloroflexota bacterium]
MELGRAISYIFEDKKWVSKLLPLLGIGLLSFLIIPMALGLGWLVHLGRNVREGLPRPLPDWTKWREKFDVGGQLLLAIILYNMPIILMSICSYTLINGIASGVIGGLVSVVTICCTAPILIAYGLVAWSMLAVGVAELIETGDTRRLFRIGHQWDVVRVNSRLVTQWGLYTLLVNIVFGMIGAIPCIGQIVLLLFAYPVQGHLMGQFAHKLAIVNKPQAESRVRNID